MVDEIERTVHHKIPGLNKLETYVLTHNRFITYLVSICSDLNETHFYKKPYRVIEIEVVISFNYVNVLKPNEHTKDYHIKKKTVKIFFLRMKIKTTFTLEMK